MPPFAGLLAFEAVLRHGSMTLAGDELGLTQSAVSHRIRALEDFFGVALLERLNPGLRVTEAGGRLAQELGPLLGTLAGMHRRIAGRTGLRVFRLGLSTALLAWWLSPRLPALCGGFPDLSVEVVTWDTAAEAACALPFPIESVFPVAAPGLLSTLCPGQDWRALPLLAKGRRGEETGREWSWSTWLQGDPGHEAIRFRDIGSSLQAAVDGNGVALARSLLAADALRQRRLTRLTRLTGSDEMQACSKRQIARWRDIQDSTAERMATWLVLSAGQSVPVSNQVPLPQLSTPVPTPFR
jgi:LysR family transcriptional regulator, glycine cleavage system transcriptional activator